MARAAENFPPLLAAFALLLASPCARADDIERARQLFAEAGTFREQGRYVEAAARLRGALSIKETPGLWFHLAHVLSESGELLAARRAYQRSSDLLARGVAAPDVEVLLGPALDRLDDATPTVTVRLPEGLAAESSAIDGEPVTPGRSVPLDPGSHRVVVVARGYEVSDTAVDLVVGDHRVVEPVMRRTPEPPERHAEAAPTASPARTVVLATELGLAAAGLSLGVIQTVARASNQDRVDEQHAALDALAPGDTSVCASRTSATAATCDALSAAIDDRHQAQTLAIVGYGVGVAGVAAFVTTLLAWPSRPGDDAGAESGVASVRLHGAVAPRGFFGGWSGRF